MIYQHVLQQSTAVPLARRRHDVTQVEKLLDALLVNVLQNGGQRREVGVNIADDYDGFHVRP